MCKPICRVTGVSTTWLDLKLGNSTFTAITFMYCTPTKYFDKIFSNISKCFLTLDNSFSFFPTVFISLMRYSCKEFKIIFNDLKTFLNIWRYFHRVQYELSYSIFLPDIIPGTIRTGGGLISFLLHVSFCGIWTQDFLVIIWNFRGYEVCFEKARIFNWGPSNLLLLSTHENGFWELSPSTNVAVSTS